MTGKRPSNKSSKKTPSKSEQQAVSKSARKSPVTFEEKTKELICVEIRARYRHLVGAFTPKYTAESRLIAWREIFEFSQTIPEGKLKIKDATQLKGIWQKWKQNLQDKVAKEGSTGAEPASDLRESEKQIWHIVHEFHKHAIEFKVAHYLYHEF